MSVKKSMTGTKDKPLLGYRSGRDRSRGGCEALAEQRCDDSVVRWSSARFRLCRRSESETHDERDSSGGSRGPGGGIIRRAGPLNHPLGRFPRGVAAPETGAASVLFIKKAVELAQLVVSTALSPHRSAKKRSTWPAVPGHTELLADLTKTRNPA
jgi:hypothetical protein